MIAWDLANWGKVIVGIVILSITIYIGVLKFQLGSARGEAAELRGKVSEVQSENKEWKRVYDILSNKVVEQAAEIKKGGELKKEADRKRIEAEKKAAPKVAQAQRTENALRDVPASSGPDCEAELYTIRQLLNTRG